MKPCYLAQIDCTAGGCLRFNSESLDAIRDWAKRVGSKGEKLTIMRSGTTIKEARVITI